MGIDLTAVLDEESRFPPAFLERCEPLERLSASTLLVRERATGRLLAARCRERNAGDDPGPELDILERVSGPGLPAYAGRYENEAMYCVLRDYIPGEPLSEAVRPPLDVERVREIGLALCAILKTLHSQDPPVIHRDVKPQNVILGEDGKLYLIDFGISRRCRQDAPRDTTVAGTQDFAPPEQYGFAQTDQRSDVYSLGVLLHWLATGRTEVGSEQAGELDRVIRRCTAFSPEKRYPSVDALARALRPRRKRILPWAAAGAALLIACALLCLRVLSPAGETPENLPAAAEAAPLAAPSGTAMILLNGQRPAAVVDGRIRGDLPGGMSYDEGSGVLTLSGARLEKLEIAGEAVTVALEGENRIAPPGRDVAFLAWPGSGVRFTGGGSLTLENREVCCLCVEKDASLTVTGGCTVRVVSGGDWRTEEGSGIGGEGSLTVNGGASLHAEGAYMGIIMNGGDLAFEDCTVTTNRFHVHSDTRVGPGAKVTVSAKDEWEQPLLVMDDCELHIDGGVLTVEEEDRGMDFLLQVMPGSRIRVSAGTLNLHSQTAVSSVFNVFGGFSQSGGETVIQTASGYGPAVRVDGGSLCIDGGRLLAEAEAGIVTRGSVAINGGEVALRPRGAPLVVEPPGTAALGEGMAAFDAGGAELALDERGLRELDGQEVTIRAK